MTAKRPVKILTWLLVLLWMLVIFHLSAQPASHSNAQSKDLVDRLVETAVTLTGADLPPLEKKQLVSRINSTAREYMHGVVFLVLGLLVYRAVTNRGLTKTKAVAIAMAICQAYGLSDEIHQLFVPGRAFELSDLVMDGLGSLIGIGLACLKRSRATP